ncbi:hypothetical protein BDZ89DRAFT_1075517 [Hymenopellis radicata]|nr:hypothetical protein BDZ89DRAFT_1075517 [Hymenopellis radicata]
MSKARWAIDGPAGTTLEVDGHKYGSEDDGAPMMCNLVCTTPQRHRTAMLDLVIARTMDTSSLARIRLFFRKPSMSSSLSTGTY